MKIAVDITVGWSFAVVIGLVFQVADLKEKFMKHLIASVFVGAALLPVPGGISFANTVIDVDRIWQPSGE